MNIVVTIDQRKSRRSDPDAVMRVAGTLNHHPEIRLRRKFVRTAGDEIQGLLGGPESVPPLIVWAAEEKAWWVGLGIGPVEELKRTTRDSTGEAFFFAREAVERAKKQPWGVAVEGPNRWAELLDEATALFYTLLTQRTERGWEAAKMKWQRELVDDVVARRLKITRQAVQQRLMSAAFPQELVGRRLLEELASLAIAEPQ